MEKIDVNKQLEILKTGNVEEKEKAIDALGKMGSDAREAVPLLIQAIKEDALCWTAVSALGNIGGKKAANVLSKSLIEDSDMGVRMRAATALGKVKDVDTIPALRKALKDRDEFVRESTCYALGEFASTMIIPDLKEVLNDNVDFVRKSAAKALEKFGEQDTLKKVTGKKPWWKLW